MYRLKDLREDEDHTQNSIADILGCTQATYSRYETGSTSLPTDILEKLADFYHVSTDYILCRTDIKQPYEPSVIFKKGK